MKVNNTKKKTKVNGMEKRKRRTGLFFILPSAVLCAVFMLWPLMEVLRYSLTDWNGLSATYNYVGLTNYKNLVHIDGFGQVIVRDGYFRYRHDDYHHYRIVYHGAGSG